MHAGHAAEIESADSVLMAPTNAPKGASGGTQPRFFRPASSGLIVNSRSKLFHRPRSSFHEETPVLTQFGRGEHTFRVLALNAGSVTLCESETCSRGGKMHTAPVHSSEDVQGRAFQLCVSEVFLQKVDEWRQEQPEPPSRSEAVRYLVGKAIAAERSETHDAD
jgi:hypothetical protein